ncbi:hypothetical protein C8Q79DRAFT_106017 [Trametes meyenii]|nr:hypothetical protein C8Q79DRAFT_106017 [Trametes meyenii]
METLQSTSGLPSVTQEAPSTDCSQTQTRMWQFKGEASAIGRVLMAEFIVDDDPSTDHPEQDKSFNIRLLRLTLAPERVTTGGDCYEWQALRLSIELSDPYRCECMPPLLPRSVSDSSDSSMLNPDSPYEDIMSAFYGRPPPVMRVPIPPPDTPHDARNPSTLVTPNLGSSPPWIYPLMFHPYACFLLSSWVFFLFVISAVVLVVEGYKA